MCQKLRHQLFKGRPDLFAGETRSQYRSPVTARSQADCQFRLIFVSTRRRHENGILGGQRRPAVGRAAEAPAGQLRQVIVAEYSDF